MHYEFTKEYLTGIEFIDKQHARLFELANETYDLLTNELITDKYDRIMDLLHELSDYTKTHFADEEEFMEAIDFQYIWSEKHQHLSFIQKIDGVDQKKLDDHQDGYILELLDYLSRWLFGHIKGADGRIGVAFHVMKGEEKEKAEKKAAEMLERYEEEMKAKA